MQTDSVATLPLDARPENRIRGELMPASQVPRLIVNADDFGRNTEATDRTIEVFRAGRITSATAMVHMEDSERAAALALEAGMPVGLHVNLTDPFTATGIPASVRARQRKACRHFSPGRLRLRSWSFDPRIRRDVESAVADQLQRFEELYGGPPSHFDGHKHVHCCPNVVLAAPLRPIGRARNGLRAWPGARGAMGALRAVRRALTYRRLLTTRYFLDIDKLFRDPDSLAARIGACRETSVEVMAHPGFPHELRALRSPLWGQALEGSPLGSYGDLSRA